MSWAMQRRPPTQERTRLVASDLAPQGLLWRPWVSLQSLGLSFPIKPWVVELWGCSLLVSEQPPSL